MDIHHNAVYVTIAGTAGKVQRRAHPAVLSDGEPLLPGPNPPGAAEPGGAVPPPGGPHRGGAPG